MDRIHIREGAEVRSADDEKLGKVVGLEGDFIIVEKGFFFPTDYYIPTSAVSSANNETVYLSVGKDQALTSGWDQMGTTAAGYDTPPTDADYATGGMTDVTTDEMLRVPVHEEELT